MSVLGYVAGHQTGIPGNEIKRTCVHGLGPSSGGRLLTLQIVISLSAEVKITAADVNNMGT